jgi:hypothetical protein
LRGPQQTSTDTKQHTGKDVEAEDRGMDRYQQANGIDAISYTSESQSPFHTNLVDEGTAKEAENRKSTVERRVLFLRLEWGDWYISK